MLGDGVLATEVAGMREDRRAVAPQVLAVLDYLEPIFPPIARAHASALSVNSGTSARAA